MRRTICAAAAILCAIGAHSSASSQAETLEPIEVVERFLEARSLGDADAAAAWLAPVLELQDVDGQWFIDTPTAADWLRLIHDRYVLEIVDRPYAVGATSTWTERLTRREPDFRDAWGFMTIQVHAVVRDGHIAYLSGAYPPLPLRHEIAAPSGRGMQHDIAAQSSSGLRHDIAARSASGLQADAAAPPSVLFGASALCLVATYAAANLASRVIRRQRPTRHLATAHRRRRNEPLAIDTLSGGSDDASPESSWRGAATRTTRYTRWS